MKGEAKIGEYTLTYDFNALCAAEEETGPLGQAMNDMGAGSLKTIRGLFWAGLQKNHPMTVQEAGLLVQDLGVDKVGAAIAKGVEGAFLKAKKGNPKAARS